MQSQVGCNTRSLIVNLNLLDETLLCGICQEFVLDPQECEKCQHLFCKNCIFDWNKINLLCPFRCSEKNLNLRSPHRVVRNQINQILIKCPNHNTGCSKQFQFKDLQEHQKECAFILVKCKFDGCDLQFISQLVDEHEQICNFKKLKCERCDQDYKIQSEHDCILSLKEKILNIEKENKNKFEELIKRIQILEECKFQSQQITQEKDAIYKCNKDHQLRWVRVRFQRCSKCGNNNWIRYDCQTCNFQICQRCLRPQFKGLYCPDNHELQFNPNPTATVLCDFCELNISSQGDQVYSDRKCNFDICSTCFQNLKQQEF